MQYRTHQIGGICAGLVVGFNLLPAPYDIKSASAIAVVVVASTIGSIIPDIDEPNSIAGRKIWLISKIIKKVFGHRMITHTPFFVVAMAVGFYFLGGKYFSQDPYYYWYSKFVFGFLVGYISHFIMDSMTPTGIMYLWPFSRNRYSIVKLRTGNKEWIASILFVVLTFSYFYFLKFPQICLIYNIPM